MADLSSAISHRLIQLEGEVSAFREASEQRLQTIDSLQLSQERFCEDQSHKLHGLCDDRLRSMLGLVK